MHVLRLNKSIIKSPVCLEEVLCMNERIQFVVIFGSISILDHITIEDAVGSVKIHDGTLIKAKANHGRKSSY